MNSNIWLHLWVVFTDFDNSNIMPKNNGIKAVFVFITFHLNPLVKCIVFPLFLSFVGFCLWKYIWNHVTVLFFTTTEAEATKKVHTFTCEQKHNRQRKMSVAKILNDINVIDIYIYTSVLNELRLRDMLGRSMKHRQITNNISHSHKCYYIRNKMHIITIIIIYSLMVSLTQWTNRKIQREKYEMKWRTYNGKNLLSRNESWFMVLYDILYCKLDALINDIFLAFFSLCNTINIWTE